MDNNTETFRNDYHGRHVSPNYRGVPHAVLVVIAVAAMLGVGIAQLRAADLARFYWVIPLTFLVANIVEYLVHRHIMHREVPGLRAMYERHARRHHRYFTRSDIEVTAARDMHAVLFPPVLLLFFSGVALLLALGVAALLGRPAGVLFFLVALAYYLAYELLHLLAHWPLSGVLARSRLVRLLVSHHRMHHAPQLMQCGNFNIVLPFGDWVFGTLQRDNRPVAQSDKPSPGVPAYEDARATTREGEHGEQRSIQT